MYLNLKQLPSLFRHRGIYGKSGGDLPDRMLWLHPLACASLIEVEREHPHVFHFSDMFRPASVSLRRRKETRRAQPPSYSAHNYGLAVDHDVRGNLTRLGSPTKAEYDAIWERHGWYCHRRDHQRKAEEWHFNFLGPTPMRWLSHAGRSTAGAIEARLQAIYGEQMRILSVKKLQEKLAQLRLYEGQVDGIEGPLTRSAVAAFQRAWGLVVDGIWGRRTQRTLAYVTATGPHLKY